jgi:hypothetical protein
VLLPVQQEIRAGIHLRVHESECRDVERRAEVAKEAT